jgi:hypothetical protein
MPIPLAPRAERVLQVPMRLQERSLWSWAACIEMVVTYYMTHAAQQCDVVGAVCRRPDCCRHPTSDECGAGVPMAVVLAGYEAFGVAAVFVDEPLSFAELRGGLNGNHAVQVGLRWAGPGRHAALVIGYDDTRGEDVFVNDPVHGQIRGTYAWLLSAYGLGEWVDSAVLAPALTAGEA